jgi:SAM-dependent methyltransferase
VTLDCEVEGRLYQDAFQILKVHELLLRDEVRNSAFYRALEASVTPASRVLDIGSGCGLWAIVAARLGAQKVVAVEREPLLIGLIKALAYDHGVADRVEVVLGDSRQLPLAREFDIVVSETIGHVVFDEQIVPIMIDARERFLKPGGRLIPETVALVAAPAHFPMGSVKLPAGIPEEFSYFRSLARHMPVVLTDKRQVQLAGETRRLVHVDLPTVTAASLQDLTKLTAAWNIDGAQRIDCVLVWAEVGLGNGLGVQTIDTSSWTATIYRFAPFAQPQGELRFDLALEALTNRWTVSLTSGESFASQSYSPAIAATELLAQTRLEPAQFRQMQQAGLIHPGIL